MRRLTMSLALAAALAAGAAAAHDDGPMATAGASGAPPTVSMRETPAERQSPAASSRPLSTAEQIDAFIKGSPAAGPSPEEMAGMDAALAPERKVHGSVEVGVGTHGYRHGRVEAHYPLGETGQVSVAVGATRGRGLHPGCLGPMAGPLDGPACLGAW